MRSHHEVAHPLHLVWHTCSCYSYDFISFCFLLLRSILFSRFFFSNSFSNLMLCFFIIFSNLQKEFFTKNKFFLNFVYKYFLNDVNRCLNGVYLFGVYIYIYLHIYCIFVKWTKFYIFLYFCWFFYILNSFAQETKIKEWFPSIFCKCIVDKGGLLIFMIL